MATGARAGIAYVDVVPDWSKFDRQLASKGPGLSKQMGKIGGQAGAKFASAATAAVKVGAAGAAGAMIYSVKKASDFEGQLSSLNATADLTGKQLEKMRKAALKAGADTKFSALEAAEAQTELAKGGLGVAKIMRGGLKSALALAAAGQMDLALASETTVNTMKLFGMQGKDAMKIADGLATAANSTTADVSDFSMALKQGGSAAKAAGFDFYETTAALEALAEQGIKGSDAGTSLKAMLTQLASPTEKAKNLMDEYGLKIFDAHGNMLPLTKLAGQFQGALGGLTREQRLQASTTLVGTDGMRALLALYDAGPKKIGRFQTELKKQGTAADVAKKKQDNLKGSLEQLSGSAETLGISIGTMAIPEIRDLADDLTDLTNQIGRIINRDDLDLGAKLDRIFEVATVDAKPWIDKIEKAISDAHLDEKFGEAVSAATPIMVEAMAKAGPKAAEAFINAFVAADLWGQLVIGGVLLKKMGGLAAFTALGTKTGRAMGTGMAAGAAKTSGGLKGAVAASAAGKGAKSIAAKAKAAVPGTVAAAGVTPAAIAGLKTMSDFLTDKSDLGLLNQYADALERVSKAGDAGGMKRLAAQMRETAQANSDITKGAHLNRFADALDLTAKSGGRDLTVLQQAFKTMAKSSGGDLERLRSDFAKFGNRSPASVAEIKTATQDVRKLFKHMAGDGSADMEHIRNAVRINSQRIKESLGKNTREGKDALALNFDLAVKAIKRSMKKGTVETDTGLAQIRKLFVKSLELYGFTPEQAKISARGRDPVTGQLKIPKKDQGTRVAQRGGVMLGGDPVGDSIPALLERGEYVVNREAVKKVGRGALDRLNFGDAPRFQKGGMAGMVAAANQLEGASFPYLWGGGHSATPAPFGPMDCSGAVSYVLQHGGVNIPTMVSGSLAGAGKPGPGAVTVFANPTHTFMRIGQRYFGTSVTNPGGGAGWFPEPSAGYLANFTQRHFEGGAGALGTEFKPLKRVLVEGVSGALGKVAQGAVDTARMSANARLKKISESVMSPIGGGDIGEGGATVSGSGAALMRKIASERGWNFADWWEIDRRETGHGTNLLNEGSGAFNRAQFMPGITEGQYGPGSLKGAPMAAQIQSMAQYIAERYGNPTAARAFHDSHNWYAKGGLIGAAQKAGKGLGARLRRGAPLVAGLGLGSALKKIRGGDGQVRRDVIRGLTDKIGAIGLPKPIAGSLTRLGTDANVFGEYASRAEQLSTTDANGDPIGAVVNGKTQAEWLQQQLTALFQWRNAIVQAEQIVVAKREETARLIGEARAKLANLSGVMGAAGVERRALAARLEKAQKKPKANRAMIKTLKARIKTIDTAQAGRKKSRDALTEKILPALTSKRSGLNDFRGTLLSDLDEVQGIGSPRGFLRSLPAVGVLGGSVLAVQSQLAALTGTKPSVTDTPTSESESARADILEQLLRESNLRTQVSERQFDVFKNMPPFGGSFDTGGIVPGPVGAARTVIAHGGETITPPEGAGSGSRIRVVVEDNRIRVFEDDVERAVERVTRRQARSGARGLPGQPGVLR